MTPTLEELKAEMDYWKAEVERVKARESDAIGKFYKAEREIERNKKPTPKQIAVLQMMKDGAALCEKGWRYPYSYYVGSERIAGVVFDGLRSREFISQTAGGRRDEYFITAWGREVLAKGKTK